MCSLQNWSLAKAALSLPLLFCLPITSLRLNPNLLFTTVKSKQAGAVVCTVWSVTGVTGLEKTWMSSACLSLDRYENVVQTCKDK